LPGVAIFAVFELTDQTRTVGSTIINVRCAIVGPVVLLWYAAWEARRPVRLRWWAQVGLVVGACSCLVVVNYLIANLWGFTAAACIVFAAWIYAQTAVARLTWATRTRESA
jgi:hypothetical protein